MHLLSEKMWSLLASVHASAKCEGVHTLMPEHYLQTLIQQRDWPCVKMFADAMRFQEFLRTLKNLPPSALNTIQYSGQPKIGSEVQNLMYQASIIEIRWMQLLRQEIKAPMVRPGSFLMACYEDLYYGGVFKSSGLDKVDETQLIIRADWIEPLQIK